MFNSFEQAHNQYLEPIEPEVVARDWGGFEIYEGDGAYWVTPDGEYVSSEDVEAYMSSRWGIIEF